MSDTWELYYWPGMPGRGEFMRLLFIETSTPFKDVYAGEDWTAVGKVNYQLSKEFFALPTIKHNGFMLSQTPVICRYLAVKLNNGVLYPKEELLGYQAEMIMAGIVDLTAEGHDAWHPIDKNATYVSQKEQAKPFIEYYEKKRLPKWFSFFEKVLAENEKKYPSFDEGGPFLVGESISYVDLCMFHILDGIEFQCPEAYAFIDVPKLKNLKTRIQNRPKIKQYLESAQRSRFTGTGPIF
ncbi:sigma-class glutathione S-transferase [Basidiobolus meristosporus CBS 931.73]|uniref:Sigma-class glutathione S-transferase n=1 Tax=Basidiobolus meristosporus CBS 931.73 TaxID=1314790 RepID=A0A1Y1YV04_9FUNG|nr:sigma-class glutathione S-transferase [Basidiobolus meristosporus CBS 931.73]|eukprot:ORY01870.1 sigma-class glutathione S-transferase [Basidiobolus meristosporus CBS 931.73]